VDVSRAGVRFRETRMAGDLSVVALVEGDDVSRGTFDLSGSTLAATDVSVAHATTEAANWGGAMTLRRASLRLDPTPRLDADLLLDARDGNPFLAIALGDALPKVFAAAAEMPRLTGTARLSAATHRWSIVDMDCRGGDLSVRGFYARRGGVARGAFVVDKGPVSAGIHVTESGFGVRLFGLDGWLRDEANAAAPLLR